MVPPEGTGRDSSRGADADVTATGGGSAAGVRRAGAGETGREDAARLEVAGAWETVCMRRAGALGDSGRDTSGAITPSDSVTAAPGATGPAGAVGASSTALDAPEALDVSGTAVWFCRTARYDPPAAAARHPIDNPATTSLLNSIAITPRPERSRRPALNSARAVPGEIQSETRILRLFSMDPNGRSVLIRGRCPLNTECTMKNLIAGVIVAARPPPRARIEARFTDI